MPEIDKALWELEDICATIESVGFKQIKKHIEEKIESLDRGILKASSTPKLDSSIEILGKAMIKKELISLLHFFEYKLDELRQVKLKQAYTPQA